MSNQAASPDQLEREIYETRAQIDRKLGLLQERLSPRNVANAMGAQGGTFARNLGTALRDNPVPALLLGIGICWLMLASRPNGRADFAVDDDVYDDSAALPPGEPAALAPRPAAAMAEVDSLAGSAGRDDGLQAQGDAAALGLTAGRR